eukprot:2142517-Prymnesium_polylepis.1
MLATRKTLTQARSSPVPPFLRLPHGRRVPLHRRRVVIDGSGRVAERVERVVPAERHRRVRAVAVTHVEADEAIALEDAQAPQRRLVEPVHQAVAHDVRIGPLDGRSRVYVHGAPLDEHVADGVVGEERGGAGEHM